jgi:hypothetical protein
MLTGYFKNEHCRELSLLGQSLVMIAIAVLMAGCGASMVPTPSPSPTPSATGTTSVVVQVSSTANGQFSSFLMTLDSITLTNNAGKSADLLPTTPQMAEFSHLNAGTALLGTATVPQDVYTSATVTYILPEFSWITVASGGGLIFNTDSDNFGVQSATVNLPSPITVSGTAMNLFLDLQVSKSASCICKGIPDTYSITPTFNLTASAISSSPTNTQNGKVTGIRGRIASVDISSNTLSVASTNGAALLVPTGPTLSLAANGVTAYHGIAGLSALASGMFVDMDAIIQPDGSLTATRIAVEDAAAVNVMIGPLAQVDQVDGIIVNFGRQQQGDDLSSDPIEDWDYSFAGATAFQTSSQFNALQNLPFTPIFNGPNMVAGQNVAVSSLALVLFGGSFTPATTITLMPQTINGTVSAISTNGAFTVYQISLPAYDVIPTLNGATSVFAYADGSTQMFNSSAISAGSVVRVNGFLFNDAGTLRMVAGQVNDGVAE